MPPSISSGEEEFLAASEKAPSISSEHDYRRPLASDARRAIDYFTGKEETRKWIAETGESTPVHYVRTRVVSLVDALSP